MFVLAISSCSADPPPDDSVLIDRFQAYEPRYHQVRAMLAEDPKVGTIGRDFLFEADKPFNRADPVQLAITLQRLSEYKRLLGMIGVERLDRYGDSTISFMHWASGYAGNTHHKGILWSSRALVTTQHRRFNPIRGNWYLYQD